MDWGMASLLAPLNWENVNLSRFLGAAPAGKCSLREFAAICPSIGDRVGRVRLAQVLLYYGWVGTMTDGSGGLLLITFSD